MKIAEDCAECAANDAWLAECDARMHASHCGPARGFKICYCECSDCRAPADENGNRRCICVGCRGWEHDRG